MSLGSSFSICHPPPLLQDRYNAAQTVKGTRQLHRFVPQPQGKFLVYNTSLQASPPTECIIDKTISLSIVQIEDNTLQGRFHLKNRQKPTATLIYTYIIIYNIYTTYIPPPPIINTLSDVKIH